jgi:hypothetical protein
MIEEGRTDEEPDVTNQAPRPCGPTPTPWAVTSCPRPSPERSFPRKSRPEDETVDEQLSPTDCRGSLDHAIRMAYRPPFLADGRRHE